MKSNRWNFTSALLYLLAGICFVIAAVLHTEIVLKVLFCIAALCLFASSIGFFFAYAKNRKCQ